MDAEIRPLRLKRRTSIPVAPLVERMRPRTGPRELTPFECGCWADHGYGLSQLAAVIRRAQAFGFELTPFELPVISASERLENPNVDLEMTAFLRAVDYVNGIAPPGYRLGFKDMDVWFMPQQWWDDLGGEE